MTTQNNLSTSMLRFLAPSLLALTLTACATSPMAKKSQSPDLPPKPLSTSTIPYQIAALDEAEITLADGTRQTTQVSINGDVDLNGTIQRVKGLDREVFQKMVRRAFPQAKSVEIHEFLPNRVTVLGEVFHQIHTDLGDGPMRVMDAIASANGFTPLANKRRIRLLRQNAGHVEVYELDLREMMRGQALAQNLLLKPGDVLTIPRNFL